MATQLKNMLIGLFVVIGCIMIIGIILFIKPRVGDGNQVIKVRFTNINGIALGTPVTYAGQPSGKSQLYIKSQMQGNKPSMSTAMSTLIF